MLHIAHFPDCQHFAHIFINRCANGKCPFQVLVTFASPFHTLEFLPNEEAGQASVSLFDMGRLHVAADLCGAIFRELGPLGVHLQIDNCYQT